MCLDLIMHIYCIHSTLLLGIWSSQHLQVSWCQLKFFLSLSIFLLWASNIIFVFEVESLPLLSFFSFLEVPLDVELFWNWICLLFLQESLLNHFSEKFWVWTRVAIVNFIKEGVPLTLLLLLMPHTSFNLNINNLKFLH